MTRRVINFIRQHGAIWLGEPRILLCARCEIRIERCQCQQGQERGG